MGKALSGKLDVSCIWTGPDLCCPVLIYMCIPFQNQSKEFQELESEYRLLEVSERVGLGLI